MGTSSCIWVGSHILCCRVSEGYRDLTLGGGPATTSHSRSHTESRRSDSHASRRTWSSVIRPSSSVWAANASQVAPIVDLARVPRPRETTEIFDDSESVSKCTRAD